MAWVPYEKYTIDSNLTSSEIKKKLASKIPGNITSCPESFSVLFINEKNTDSFQVDITNDHFTVKEKVDLVIGGYTNSFRPEAFIKFGDNSVGSTSTITIKPVLSIIIITCLMLCFVLIGGVSLLLTNKTQIGLLVISIFPLLIFLLVTFSFNVELDKLKSFIDSLLEIDYID
jgi:hypothetical protein